METDPNRARAFEDLVVAANSLINYSKSPDVESGYTLVETAQLIEMAKAMDLLFACLKADGQASADPNVTAATLEIPPNVKIVLCQYLAWGIDVYSFEEVEAACRRYTDMDVYEYLHQNRPLYKIVVADCISQ